MVRWKKILASMHYWWLAVLERTKFKIFIMPVMLLLKTHMCRNDILGGI